MKFFFKVFIASLIGSMISGDGLYNPKKQICCNGTIHDDPFLPGDYYCCNTELVNSKTTSCCRGQQINHANVFSQKVECCYSQDGAVKIFNPKKEICCQGIPTAKPNSYMVIHCCGEHAYNFYETICCDTRQYTFQFNSECCGEVLIKTTKNTDIECCGNVIINPTEQICCKTSVIRSPFELGDPDKTYYEGMIYDRTNSRSECCGLKLYDSSKEICCKTKGQQPYVLQLLEVGSNKGKATCCGNVVILDRTEQICCGGTVHERSSLDIECCNNEVIYDHKTQICCGKKLYDKKKYEGRRVACCKSAGKLYELAKQECCGDQVVPKPNDSETRDFFGRKISFKCCKKY